MFSESAFLEQRDSFAFRRKARTIDQKKPSFQKHLSLIISAESDFGASKSLLHTPKSQDTSFPKKTSDALRLESFKGSWNYRLHPDKAFNPASLVKIILSGAILSSLPLDYTFKTQLFILKHHLKHHLKHQRKKKILNGSLYMKGGGDSTFTSESLWQLVNAFVRTNLKHIKGGIVVDDTLFDKKRHSHRRPHRVQDSYDAPIGALSFNWNSVNVFVRPSKRNQPVLVFIDPKNEYIRLIQKAYTRRGGKNRLQVNRIGNTPPMRDSISVSGSLGEKAKEKVFYRNITKPDIWTGYNLKSFLEQRKIQVEGKVSSGVTPSQAVLVAEFESQILKHSLVSLMKFSNNYVADMLAKSLAAHQNERPATLATGLEIVRKYLDGLPLSRQRYTLKSASGLQRKIVLEFSIFTRF